MDSLPQFVGGDPFSYELTEGSPCIDAGNPDTTGLNLPEYDLAGNPRIYNYIVNMGAYEWQGNAVDKPDTSFIHKLYLFQNIPNPFSYSTTITFISADYERIKDYKVSIHNAKGQLIKTYNGKKHNFWVKTDIVWNGTNENGNKVSPGVYFYKLNYGNNVVTRKMILVK
ncbi:MAG: T9SS type A sorting domain-containing protein [Candidatus Cloacimonetes bacterium]|nr:T9SS type A sorting domain-containing protein [Candidatus Cloacimonadota bacterium]